jgi:hypothetical protein
MITISATSTLPKKKKKTPCELAQGINYIIFKNVEIFRQKFIFHRTISFFCAQTVRIF